MESKKLLLVYTTPRTKEQHFSFEKVKSAVKKSKLSFQLANRDKLTRDHFKDKELILAFGGDGTFLRAAQFIDEQVVMGINSDPKDKEGFYMCCDANNFEIKLKQILNNNFKVRKLSRIGVSVGSRKIDCLALNEFFIGQKKAYQAAKYTIQFKGIVERQKSSGVLITTPHGSFAWANACCGRKMDLNSDCFQFVVREPYEGNVYKEYRLLHGIIKKNEKIRIISEMLDGIIVADSVEKEIPFRNGMAAEFSLSKKYLNAIWPK